MNDIKLIFRDNVNEYTQPLKEKGCNIWSISRLNNFNTCKKQYYYTYIDKKQQKTGVYSLLGSSAHADLEDLYEGKYDKLQPNNFNDDWLKAELFNIKFPESKYNIKGNYKKDMDLFYKYYKKMEGKFISELGFILEIDEKNYIMGYIDLLEVLDNNTVKVYDFKTSAMFKDKKLIDAGRQLCIYQMALEQLYGLNVVDNGWIMLKYSDVQIGNSKPKKAIQNKDLIKSIKSQLKTLLKKYVDPSLADIYIMKCEADGDIDCLPEEVKKQIKITTHFKPYEITEDVKKETMEYIRNTITNIENETEWNCNVNEFFCKNLCSFSDVACDYKLEII